MSRLNLLHIQISTFTQPKTLPYILSYMRCPYNRIRHICICRMSKQNDTVIEMIQCVLTSKLFKRVFIQNPAPCYAERLKLFLLDRLTIRILKLNIITMY